MSMNENAAICDYRNGYLGRWLTVGERTEFEAHLAHCLSCRQIVQAEAKLDDLLARANTVLRPVPTSLVHRVEQRLRRARRRRISLWAASLAIAGLLFCVLAAWFLIPRAADNGPRPSPDLTKRARPCEPPRDPRALVQVKLENPSDVIPVPQKTDNPSVTIIWLYPTIKAAREPRSAPPEFFLPPERNGI